jgi:hypothetical protein
MYTTYIKYNRYLGSFPGGKWSVCNSDNPPPSSAEDKLYTYIPPSVPSGCYRISFTYIRNKGSQSSVAGITTTPLDDLGFKAW